MISEEYVRDYEISLWDLQDNFITVLKPMQQDTQGTILEPKMSLVDDGTQELTFSIPMYIVKDNDDKVENPIWYNTINGNLIADMRKLKVIFNKATSDEEIFEFLITKVQDNHSSGQINCEITSEGLAFHELGKQGYKIALQYENFETVHDAWEKNKQGEEPIANLQFWNEENGLNFLPYPGDDAPVDANIWYYEIKMDWSSYSHSHARTTDKVYEEEYVMAWDINNGIATPKENSIKQVQEKARIVDLTESNYYNLTQDLANAFGVFCKYKYRYDDNYHIIGRRVIYYNNFIKETDGAIDFTYPYSSSAITREMDGTDLITKMYVKTLEDESTPEGFISIMGTEANLSGEDYILNFEYMKKIGAISDDQYSAIKTYEAQMGEKNRLLVEADNKLNSYELEKPKLEAAKSLAEAGIKAAQSGIDENAALRNNLDLRDGDQDGYITSPVRVMRLSDTGNGTKILKLSEKGIQFSSIKIYTSYDFSNNEGSAPLTITESQAKNDEFDNLERIEDIETNVTQVYVTYKYNPELYYERIINTWNTRLAKDQAKLASSTADLETLNTNIERYQEAKNTVLNQKKEIQIAFDRLMGPALREGNWAPENYKNCENTVTETFSISNINDTDNLLWDQNLFDEEQTNNYKVGIVEEVNYYPYIEINQDIAAFLKGHDQSKVCLIYYDYTFTETNPSDIKKSRRIMLGGGLQFAYKYDAVRGSIPILMLTAAKNMSALEITQLINTNKLVELTIEENNSNENKNEKLRYIPVYYNATGESGDGTTLTFTFITSQNIYSLVNLRYQINTLSIKTGEKYLYVHLGDTLLKEYYDYSTLVKDGKFYITIKPSVIFNRINDAVTITYTLSNASTAIYLDAKEVLKENAVPRVSYTVETCILNKTFMHTAYNRLNTIININDYDLKFENVQGYISSLNLDLDKPWEDTIEVKNYKTKFEDLFTSIVASTEQMQKNANIYYSVSQVLNPDGTFKTSSLQKGLSKADLNYAFNNGTLSITNENGIIGISENGVVAMRGGGIFTATDKDKNGDWIWNTGITPQGINAQLITTGQLDTNRVVVYAGDEVKFQLNDKGLFAYKSYVNDANILQYMASPAAAIQEMVEEEEPTEEPTEQAETPPTIPVLWFNENEQQNYLQNVNKAQYVVYNSEGLFLHVDAGAKVLDIIRDPTNFDNITAVNMVQATHAVDRVEISWEGLILRNWNNKAVFYADHEGNLNLEGTIYAASGNIGGWVINSNSLTKDTIDANTNEVTHVITISPTTGFNFNDKFIVDTDGIMTIKSSDNTTIFKATSQSIGFYNYYTTQEQNQDTQIIHEDSILTLSGSTLNVNGTLNVNASGELKLTTNNLCIDSNIDLEYPSDTANNNADKYYNIYSLGENLLATQIQDRKYHIQYKMHTNETNQTTDYIFSIGNQFKYIFNDNGNELLIGNTSGSYLQYTNSNGLVIKGDLTATTLTVGNNGSYMKYDQNGLNIGNGGLTYNGTTFSVTGNINATSGTFSGTVNASGGTFSGTINGGEFSGATIITDNLTVGSTNSALTYSSDAGLNIGGFITYKNNILNIGKWIVGDQYFYSDGEGGIGIHYSNGSDWAVVLDITGVSVGQEVGGYNITLSAGGGITASGFLSTPVIYVTDRIVKVNSSLEPVDTYITSSSLSDYATQAWVQQQGYISSLTGYTTETWVYNQIKAALDKNGLTYPDGW